MRVQGSGLRVQGPGFRVQDSGCRIQKFLAVRRPARWVFGFGFQGSGFRVQGSGFRVQGLEFRIQGSTFRVQDSFPNVKDLGLGVDLEACGVKALVFLRVFQPARLLLGAHAARSLHPHLRAHNVLLKC